MTDELSINSFMLRNKSIANVEEANDPNIVWRKECVMVTDRWIVGPSPYFWMMVGRKENPKATYVRPIEKHHDGVFEDLFNFGCECAGFTTERVVKIE